MDGGDTRRGRCGDGTHNETARLGPHLLGLRVRITVECVNHGSHTATVRGPFLWVIDLVNLFRDVTADCDRWVVCEYAALDYVPQAEVGEWE